MGLITDTLTMLFSQISNLWEKSPNVQKSNPWIPEAVYSVPVSNTGSSQVIWHSAQLSSPLSTAYSKISSLNYNSSKQWNLVLSLFKKKKFNQKKIKTKTGFYKEFGVKKSNVFPTKSKVTCNMMLKSLLHWSLRIYSSSGSWAMGLKSLEFSFLVWQSVAAAVEGLRTNMEDLICSTSEKGCGHATGFAKHPAL